ncbi:MAG: hypothetical protein EXR07_06770 [Acetobacteraceae bacterium]|nr:hypothetical protein [Acetobacteraceae bacterium]
MLIVVPIATLMALIGYRLLTGQIRTTGLLLDNVGAFSPSRLQMLLSTTFGAGFYLFASLRGGNAGTDLPGTLPTLLAFLGGSHALYLTQKWFTLRPGKEAHK